MPRAMSRPLHNKLIACIAALFLVASAIAATPVSYLPADEAAQGWIRLFDGSSRFGWITSGAEWQTNANTLTSDPAQQSTARTTFSFSDFDLKFDARVTGGSATLLFRTDPQSKPAQPGFALSLNDGSIAGVGGGGAHTSGWTSYEVRADGKHVTVSMNGKVTADGDSGKNRVGYFEFDSPRGTRVEIRSVLLKPLNLDSLYNGSNLDGWHAVPAPAPQSKSKIHLPIPGLSGKPKAPPTVQWTGQGTIHGRGGVGQLESGVAYDDLVAQFTARVSGKDERADAEIFFRGTANQFNTGYAVSATDATDHQLEDGKSYGTGGLVALQKSRSASIASGQNFTCILVARAHRISIWINGALVTDYYDSRPEGTYHAAAGPLGFRLQSDKSVLDVSAVRAASLPKGPEAPPPPAPVVAATPTPAPATSAAPAAAPTIIMPGQSPQEKAQQEQIRKLTVDALNASSPEEALRINKQILVLDPGDMPAQQRLDKAQAAIDAANAQQQRGMQDQQASEAKVQANAARRDQLVAQTQDDLLRGNLNDAQNHLNDAQRFGAAGPEIDRLRALIQSRIRNRLLLRLGLGGGGLIALVWALIYFFRRRGKTTVAYLVALDGIDKGKRYMLSQEVTHMGGVAMDGVKKNEVLVRDPDHQVSRFHCEVHKRSNHYYLIDLASSNGTYLRNQPLKAGVAARLRDGDKFILARAATFELRVEKQSTN